MSFLPALAIISSCWDDGLDSAEKKNPHDLLLKGTKL